MYDPELYRDKAEVERWKERDPIPTLVAGRLREPGLLDDDAVAALEAEVAAEIDDAVGLRGRAGAARAGRADLTPHVYARSDHDRDDEPSTMTSTYREAMREALREALRADDRVFLMGEDVGRYGGCFAVTQGPARGVRPERIRDTPLSESAFVGAGIGAAHRRDAPDRRDHDGQLQPAGARPDPEQRGDAAAHVRRSGRRARWSSG